SLAGCHTRCMRAQAALRIGRLAWLVLGVAAALVPIHASAAAPHVEQADLNGDINNVMSAYMQNAVSRAEADHADALLVVMNTPGGISTSMDEIVTSLLNSKVPVIVYVYPSGARAASAGLFVAQAADVVAMAPGTNIGSAHPIDATGADLTGDLGAKVLNDAVTRVRSLASMHGRNADWAEDAVRHSVNISAEEAVRLHVADLESNDIPSLLAVVSLANLPVNIAGALMLIVALGLFIADVKANTHGILSAGGVLALVLGLAFLINTGPIGLGVNPVLIALSGLISFGFFVFFVQRIWMARRAPVAAGSETLVGASGEARQDIAPEGLVFVGGALWTATTSGEPIKAGT